MIWFMAFAMTSIVGQSLVADELGVPIGTYYHFAHDLHIYKRHFNMQEKYYKQQLKNL